LFNRGPVTNPSDPFIAVSNIFVDNIYRLLMPFSCSHYHVEEASSTINTALLAFGGANVFVFDTQRCPRLFFSLFRSGECFSCL
jgi:hypothetical protein